MAIKPGGRSPSTEPPPTPTPPADLRRPAPGRGTPGALQAALQSVVRRGLFFGGLIIIADLSAHALIQRAVNPDDRVMIDTVDQLLNYVLFSILGVAVVRDTGLIYLGAVAGMFAALLDGIVVALAASLAPTAGQVPSLAEYFVQNLSIGIVFAGISGVMYALVRRWSGGQQAR